MRLHALVATEAGLDVIRFSRDLPWVGVIGLAGADRGDAASGAADVAAFCSREGLPFVPVSDYTLRGTAARKAIEAVGIDVLVVVGWQRLVPPWLIAHCRQAVIGAHGSPFGITEGRGRSPQNWALLLGLTSFELSIFRIDPGVDSGRVLASTTFPITPHDDIASSYLKTSWWIGRLLSDVCATGSIPAGRPQVETDARYLPQRVPDDGWIDWTMPAPRVHDTVRALGHPYPGARTSHDGATLTIWRGRPVDPGGPTTGRPGEVLRAGAGLLVQTGDGWFLAEDVGCDDALPAPGSVLDSVPFADQVRRIVERHIETQPTQPLHPAVLAAANVGS